MSHCSYSPVAKRVKLAARLFQYSRLSRLVDSSRPLLRVDIFRGLLLLLSEGGRLSPIPSE